MEVQAKTNNFDLESRSKMNYETLILSSTATIKTVPNKIILLPAGNIISEKGNFVVDKESFELVKNNMIKQNRDIVIDYEHQSLKKMQAPASGWITNLSFTPAGIMAEVEWTNRAKEYIYQQQYRYLSPVIHVRNADRKVNQIHSVALTNTPAIHGMIPLNSSLHSRKEEFKKEEQSELEQILYLLNLSKNSFYSHLDDR